MGLDVSVFRSEINVSGSVPGSVLRTDVDLKYSFYAKSRPDGTVFIEASFRSPDVIVRFNIDLDPAETMRNDLSTAIEHLKSYQRAKN